MSLKSRKKTTAAAPGVTYTPVTSLAQLTDITNTGPIVVERIVKRGDKFEGITLSGRRLTPAEVKEVKILLEMAFPPELTPEKPDGPPRYDFKNPEYLKNKEENMRSARAYALICAFPVFGNAWREHSAGKTTGVGDMKTFLEKLSLEDDLLQSAYEELTKTVVFVDWNRVVFSSGSKSRKS